jgi:hypothetical protein
MELGPLHSGSRVILPSWRRVRRRSSTTNQFEPIRDTAWPLAFEGCRAQPASRSRSAIRRPLRLASRGLYRGENYPDMSEYVVHFTKDVSDTKTAYENIMSILHDGHLRPGQRTFGSAKDFAWLGDMRRVVCFSEVPLPYVSRLARRRSQYGVGFTQKFVSARHGARVWYLDVGSAHEQVWLQLQAERAKLKNPTDPFWGLAACVDRSGFHGCSRYEFEWEREWRVVGPAGLHFGPTDVEFLFIPEEHHSAAHGFFAEFFDEVGMPGFDCPFVDPLWAPDRVMRALT